MEKVKALLESAMHQEVSPELCGAIVSGTPVIIDGNRHRATGKSSLCEALRQYGVNAHEVWEFEEGLLDFQPDTNRAAVCIWLGQGVNLSL